MKRTVLIFMFAMMAMVYSQAQQIAVVSKSGSTDVYQTLKEAIEGASRNSVIYLPGGGFQIHDSVKITKPLTIIGIGHKANSENADGNTVISGNLFFNEGSSNSAIMGCYISGNVIIGDGGASVDNVLIRYCNLNAVDVRNNTCTGTIVNQNYIRNGSGFNEASCTFTNNIAHSICNLDGGTISNNIITSSTYVDRWTNCCFALCDNCTISYNILLDCYHLGCGGSCHVFRNMIQNAEWGDDFVNVTAEWADVFSNYNNGSITPASEFKFKGEYNQYSECGIYGGTGFSDGALPPVPYIVSKSIPEQTDASGKLNIKIRVKAGE